jgi:Tol biopolymer transport system component
LVIAKADGSDEKTLASHKLSDSFCLGGIAWSPDGKTIACSLNYNVAGENLMNVSAVRVSDGTETRISSVKWRDITGIAWLGEGRGLLVVAAEKGDSLPQIFHLSYPAGEVRQITHDLYDHRGISLAPNSRKLVTITNTWFSNIWVVPAKGDGRRTRQVTSGREDYADLSWTPEGNLLATRTVNGKPDLWVMDTEGKNRKQLTFGPYLNFRGHYSPDSRHIVYMSNQKGSYNIWRMDADGANKIPLTTGPGEYSPRVSPDSRWVYYYSDVSGQRSVWKVQMEGGAPMRLTNKTASHPVVSPDGTLIACKYLDEQKSSKWQVAVIPISGGEPVKTFELPYGIIRWAPDGKSLTYFDTRDGVSNLWAQPLDGGRPKRLTDFSAERITIFDWSRDGSLIGLIRVSDINDLALLID